MTTKRRERRKKTTRPALHRKKTTRPARPPNGGVPVRIVWALLILIAFLCLLLVRAIP